MSQSKVYPDAASALKGVTFDGMVVMSGGFGLSGNPENLITALKEDGVKNITVIANNCGADGLGLWVLLNNGQIKKMISSYVGENKLFEELFHGREPPVPTGHPGLLMAAPRTSDAAIVGRAIDDIGASCRRGDVEAALAILRRHVPEFTMAEADETKTEGAVPAPR